MAATYLVHAFRWPRQLVRIHVIMNNLLDAAPDWTHFDPHLQQSLCGSPSSSTPSTPTSTSGTPAGFTSMFASAPQRAGTKVWTVEEWDPTEEGTEWCRPFCYVADEVREVLSTGAGPDGVPVSQEAVRRADGGWYGADGAKVCVGGPDKGLSVGDGTGQAGAMERLRDVLAPGSQIGWFVVYCGDELRDDFGDEEEQGMEEDGEYEDVEDGSMDGDEDGDDGGSMGRKGYGTEAGGAERTWAGQSSSAGMPGWASGLVGTMKTGRQTLRGVQ